MDFFLNNAYWYIIILIFIVSLLLIIKWFLNKEVKEKRIEFHMAFKKELLPQRLRAYERITLLLERISPESLVLREQKQGLTCMQFHTMLLRIIRQEFEHNLAMQIYISSHSWSMVEKCRDEVLKLINTSASSVNPANQSIELGTAIINNATSGVNNQIDKALETLRKDVEILYK